MILVLFVSLLYPLDLIIAATSSLYTTRHNGSVPPHPIRKLHERHIHIHLFNITITNSHLFFAPTIFLTNNNKSNNSPFSAQDLHLNLSLHHDPPSPSWKWRRSEHSNPHDPLRRDGISGASQYECERAPGGGKPKSCDTDGVGGWCCEDQGLGW